MPHTPHMMKTMPITVVETTAFTRRAEKLLSAEAKVALIDYLACNPEAGDEIEGTGGVRKVRFAAYGRGKSGGVRVIYYYYTDALPLYALLVYAKNEQADLSPEQRKAARVFVQTVKDRARGTSR